jgi:hypothetical protein
MKSLKVAISAFAGLCGVAVLVAIAHRSGLMADGSTRRALGIVVGLLAIVTGNFLPKFRLLSVPGNDPVRASSAEWFAGWTLVMAGIGYVALFSLLPLEYARVAAALLGSASIVAIAVNWAGLLKHALSPGEGQSGQQRKKMIYLMFAFVFIFIEASVVSFSNEPWVREVGSWMSVGFSVIFAVLYPMLQPRRACTRS